MQFVHLYNGVPLEGMTKEELIEAVVAMASLLRSSSEAHKQTLNTLAISREARKVYYPSNYKGSDNG